MGAARGRNAIWQAFVFLNISPINQPEVMIGNAAEPFDAQGNLTDEPTMDHIRLLRQSLVAWTARRAQSQGKSQGIH